MNKFASLDAQDEMSNMAKLSPQEMREYSAYLDELEAKWDKENLCQKL